MCARHECTSLGLTANCTAWRYRSCADCTRAGLVSCQSILHMLVSGNRLKTKIRMRDRHPTGESGDNFSLSLRPTTKVRMRDRQAHYSVPIASLFTLLLSSHSSPSGSVLVILLVICA